jgi:hypothetical protein
MAGNRFVFIAFFVAGDPVASCAPFSFGVTETVFHVFAIFRIGENQGKLKIPLETSCGRYPAPELVKASAS